MLAMDSSTVSGTGMPLASRGPSKFSISWPLSYDGLNRCGQTAAGISDVCTPGRFRSFHGDAPHARRRCASAARWRSRSLLHGERTLADAAVAQRKARLLEEILFFPHRQLVLLRQANGYRRADLLAAAAEDAAPEVKLPSQLAGFQVRFHR